MRPVVAIVHATRNAIGPINEVFGARLQDAEVLNFLDEAMLVFAWRECVTAPVVLERMESIFLSAEKAGADLIVTSCSSLSPAVDMVRGKIRVPVLRNEVPLAEEAISRFRKVGVVATTRTAIDSFRQLLATTASAPDGVPRAVYRFCEGAFDALSANDSDTHDRMVVEEVCRLSRQKLDAILLPQVSVSRVVKKLPDGLPVPVLSSVYVSVGRVAEIIRGMDDS